MIFEARAQRALAAASAFAFAFSTGPLAIAPAAAQQGGQGWRALCVPGNEVEILIGSEWYRGTVTGPNTNGETECGVTTTAYTGRPMDFAMAPERMRPVQVPDAAGPPTGPAPRSGEVPRGQQAWRALCQPGAEVEILVGNAWYNSVVVGPSEFGEQECGVLNTSYSGRPMEFAVAPERMRAPGGQARPQPPAPGLPAPTPRPAVPSLAGAPPVTADLAKLGEDYRTNTPAARQRYENRMVTLTGTLQSVGSDYVRLTDGPFGVAWCTFDEGARGQLASLRPGARLTVQGDDTEWGWGTFRLQGCRVLGQQARAAPPQTPDRRRADGRPPLGRYVCRQYMTTIGYIQLGANSYTVNGVRGSYGFDSGSGAIRWNGGAYAGWPARYEFSAAGAGHANDEHIIRMTDEGDRLRIDCFLMAE